ncbi:8533_t:CDS:2 [Paraglomus occultum]|uniref:8533_t:CDS:1 n=1 Tax=Paraglomus occultum TaxID=144539 RepID=A0A9N9A7P4_9GLOM|nr:8533_t:CDS:2 [Paraglomus occultum]
MGNQSVAEAILRKRASKSIKIQTRMNTPSSSLYLPISTLAHFSQLIFPPCAAHDEWDNVDDFDPFPVEEESESPSSTQSPFTPSPPEEIGREEITSEFADSHRNSSDIFQKMGLVDLYFLPFLAAITYSIKIGD